MQLILHVGLPKTATTTIQHVMDSMKPALIRQGVLYPGSTRSQMQLVRRTLFARTEKMTGSGSLEEAMAWVADEIRQVGPKRVVLSCERMILMSAGAVQRMHRAVATWLPVVQEVRVLAYVRDPVDWATSLCQQRLKMGTARLAEFEADPWPLGLEEMLGKYVDRYGLKAVTLRHLRPDRLLNGSVVDDFLTQIGLPGFAVPGAPPTLNRSLTLHGAQIADVVAELVPRGRRKGGRKRMYRQMLQAIDGPRFVLPQEVQARILAASATDRDYVRGKWGVELGTERMQEPDHPGLEAAVVRERAQALIDEVERRAAQDASQGD
jgi:hypothetical protein